MRKNIGAVAKFRILHLHYSERGRGGPRDSASAPPASLLELGNLRLSGSEFVL